MGPFEQQVERNYAAIGEAQENPECPACGGPGVPMGGLGNLEYFRCRNCGAQFSRDTTGESLDESKDSTGTPLKPGDEVVYSSSFLRSIGMHTGDMANDVGVVQRIKPLGARTLVVVDFDIAGEMKVISSNLTRKDRVSYEPR